MQHLHLVCWGTRAPCLQKCQGGSWEERIWACGAGWFHTARPPSIGQGCPEYILILLTVSMFSSSSEQRSSQALRVSCLAPMLPQLLRGAGWKGASPSRWGVGFSHPCRHLPLSCSPWSSQMSAHGSQLDACLPALAQPMQLQEGTWDWLCLGHPVIPRGFSWCQASSFQSNLSAEVYLACFFGLVFCYSLGLCEYCLEQSKSKCFITVAQLSSSD